MGFLSEVFDKLRGGAITKIAIVVIVALTPVHYQVDKVLSVLGIHLGATSNAENIVKAVAGDTAAIAALIGGFL